MLFHSYQGMLDFLWCVRTTSTTSYPLVKLVYSRSTKNKKDTLTKRLMTAWKWDIVDFDQAEDRRVATSTYLTPFHATLSPLVVPKEQLSIGVFSAHNFKLATTLFGQVGSELITWVTLVLLRRLFFRPPARPFFWIGIAVIDV